MSDGVNKVILMGNLTKDPQIRYTQENKAVTNFSMATNEIWKDRETGERKSKVEYHRIFIFGKMAEVAVKYLSKGSRVYIEGSLQTRKWKDNSGVDRYITEVIVNLKGVLKIIDFKKDSPQETRQELKQNTVVETIDFDDDIPF